VHTDVLGDQRIARITHDSRSLTDGRLRLALDHHDGMTGSYRHHDLVIGDDEVGPVRLRQIPIPADFAIRHDNVFSVVGEHYAERFDHVCNHTISTSVIFRRHVSISSNPPLISILYL